MFTLFISGCSVFAMLFACMVINVILPGTDMVTLFILAYNGTVGLFIVISAIPVAVFIVVFGFIYNAISPTMQPLIENLLKFIVPMINFIFAGADITVTSFVPSTIGIDTALTAWTGFITALSVYLLDIADLPLYSEATNGSAELIIRHCYQLVSRHL